MLQPKPTFSRPRPVLYAGGESEAAKDLIARPLRRLRHARRPASERIRDKIADMSRAPRTPRPTAHAIRRRRLHASYATPNAKRNRNSPASPMSRSATAAGYDNYLSNGSSGTKLETKRITIEEYSVSNRGLRPGLVGTAAHVSERIAEFEDAGCQPATPAMQPAGRGNGTLRRRGHPTVSAKSEMSAGQSRPALCRWPSNHLVIDRKHTNPTSSLTYGSLRT